MMTGEDVMRGAEIIRRWQRLHRLHATVLGDEKGIIGIASALVGDPENSTIADAAFRAMKKAAVAEIVRVIQCVHGEAADLGISPPFPSATTDV